MSYGSLPPLFFMWTLIIERLSTFSEVVGERIDWLQLRLGRPSRANVMERKADPRKALSESKSYINDNMSLIATCVALSATWAVGHGDGYDRSV